MASEDDEDCLDDGESGCDCETAKAIESSATVTITIETWSKRIRMAVSGHPETVTWIVDRFWKGMRYDL